MKKIVPELLVYGGDDRIEALTNRVHHGEKLSIGKLDVECLFTPCHTKGHICYVVKPPGQPQAVFTGNQNSLSYAVVYIYMMCVQKLSNVCTYHHRVFLVSCYLVCLTVHLNSTRSSVSLMSWTNILFVSLSTCSGILLEIFAIRLSSG